MAENYWLVCVDLREYFGDGEWVDNTLVYFSLTVKQFWNSLDVNCRFIIDKVLSAASIISN